MAKDDDKQHQMLFDLRGKRRNLVKVVYAVLAILMGGSLFISIGGFNISELFNDGNSTADVAKPYEEEAERIEAKLAKNPEDPDLLVRLTRAQINAGNNSVEREDNGQIAITSDAQQRYLEAYQSWSEYLEATKEPNPGLALVVAPMLIQMAEYSRSYPEATTRIEAAVDAQRIVAEAQPSVGAWTTLAYYTFFTGDSAAAEKAKDEAKKLTRSKAEAQSIDAQLEPVEKNATKYLKQKVRTEKAEKAAAKGKGPAPESLEDPLGGLGGGLGE